VRAVVRGGWGAVIASGQWIIAGGDVKDKVRVQGCVRGFVASNCREGQGGGEAAVGGDEVVR
jgi:hypothetical protein